MSENYRIFKSVIGLALPAEQYKQTVYKQFMVPTEVVISEANTQPVPQYGRIYNSSFYNVDGRALSYLEAREVESEPYNSKPLYWMELWTDWGDDGHIEYHPSGYILLEWEGIEWILNEMKGHYSVLDNVAYAVTEQNQEAACQE